LCIDSRLLGSEVEADEPLEIAKVEPSVREGRHGPRRIGEDFGHARDDLVTLGRKLEKREIARLAERDEMPVRVDHRASIEEALPLPLHLPRRELDAVERRASSVPAAEA